MPEPVTLSFLESISSQKYMLRRVSELLTERNNPFHHIASRRSKRVEKSPETNTTYTWPDETENRFSFICRMGGKNDENLAKHGFHFTAVTITPANSVNPLPVCKISTTATSLSYDKDRII